MKFVGKKMTVVINRLSVTLSGGMGATGNNIRPGQSLGFIDTIQSNSLFGQTVYPDIFHRAAGYFFHIVKNHVFFDGNKRTALAVAVTFLEINGYLFHPLNEDDVYNRVVAFAAGDNDSEHMIPKIASWLESLCIF